MDATDKDRHLSCSLIGLGFPEQSVMNATALPCKSMCSSLEAIC